MFIFAFILETQSSFTINQLFPKNATRLKMHKHVKFIIFIMILRRTFIKTNIKTAWDL